MLFPESSWMLIPVLFLVLCVIVLEVLEVCLTSLHARELLLGDKRTTHGRNEETISHVAILPFTLAI